MQAGWRTRSQERHVSENVVPQEASADGAGGHSDARPADGAGGDSDARRAVDTAGGGSNSSSGKDASPSPPARAPAALAPSPPSPPPQPQPAIIRFVVTPRFLARVGAAAWTGLEDADAYSQQAEEEGDPHALLLARLLPALLPAKASPRRRRAEQQEQQQRRQQQQQAPASSFPTAGDEEQGKDGGVLPCSLAAPPPPPPAPVILLRLDPASADAVPDRSPLAYARGLFRLALFYWSLVSDACLLGALFAIPDAAGPAPLPLLALACALAVLPHALTALLLVARQGWLGAAWQAALFILSLNPLRGLAARARPRGAAGALLLASAAVAYALVAVSGALFVAYCLACYLLTALLFSLLALDLATLVVEATPQKACFKYSDLVYGEAYKTTRLAVHVLLQSLPSLLTVVAYLAYAGGPLPGTPAVPRAWWERLWGCQVGDEAAGFGGGGHGAGGGSSSGRYVDDAADAAFGRRHGGHACSAPPVPTFPLAAAVGVPAAVVAQAGVAHLLNAVDKLCMLRASADAAGCAPGWRGLWLEHGRSVLGVRAASYVARPVVEDNVERMPRERPDPPPMVALAEAQAAAEEEWDGAAEEQRHVQQRQQQQQAEEQEEQAAGEQGDDADGDHAEDDDDDETGGLLGGERPQAGSGGDSTAANDVENPQTAWGVTAPQRRLGASRRRASERARLNRRLRRLPGPSALLLSAGDEADNAERRAAERAAANDDIASVVPDWLAPADGARLCAGQLGSLASAGFARYAGPGVRDLALDLTRHTRPGRVVTMAAVAFPRLSCVRLARARVAGAPDASAFAAALLALPSLSALQMHACELDAHGVDAFAAVLRRAPGLVAVELCGSTLPSRGPAGVAAGVSLAHGVRGARRLRDLSLAGTRLHAEALEAVAWAIADSAGAGAANDHVGGGGGGGQQQQQQQRQQRQQQQQTRGLVVANLSYCGEGAAAMDGGCGALAALLRSPLQLLAVGLDELGERGGQALVRAVLDAPSSSMSPPPSPSPSLVRPSIAFRWSLGVAPVEGLVAHEDDGNGGGEGGGGDAIRVVVVGNRESVSYGDAWSALVADAASERRKFASQPPPPPPPPTVLALVLTQDEAATWRLRLPRLFVPTHGGMESLDLSGLGIGDAGAAAAAREMLADAANGPPVRRFVLADNAIGADGARALAGAIEGIGGGGGGGGGETALDNEEEQEGGQDRDGRRDSWPWRGWWRRRQQRQEQQRQQRGRASPSSAVGEPLLPGTTTTTAAEPEKDSGDVEAPPPAARPLAPDPPLARLEVLDLSCNDFDDDVALALASAIAGLGRGAGGGGGGANSGGGGVRCPPLRVVLAGNKLPFAPETLRALAAAARSNRRRVRLQLDEAPEITVARLEACDPEGAQRARAFFARQAERRAARRRRRAERSSGIVGAAAAEATAAAAAAVVVPSAGALSSPRADADAPAAMTTIRQSAAMTTIAPSSDGSDSGGQCRICFDASLRDGGGVALRFCGHFLCVSCYRRVWEVATTSRPSGDHAAGPLCPFCRSKLEGYYYLATDDEDDEDEGEDESGGLSA